MPSGNITARSNRLEPLVTVVMVIAGALIALPGDCSDSRQPAQVSTMATAPAPIFQHDLVTYQMSHNNSSSYHDGYVDFYSDAWAYHALRWKNLSQSESYSPSWVSPPAGWVWQDHDIMLNDNEANTCVFPEGDPAGGWGNNWAWDFKELAVGAGMFMDRWGSPVYTNMYINGDHVPVVIRSVTFKVDNPFGADNMAALCDFWGWNAREVDVEQTAQRCAFQEHSYFSVSSMVISYWHPYLVDELTISGESKLTSAFPYGDTFIGDPEDGAIELRMTKTKTKTDTAPFHRCRTTGELVHPAID